MTKEEDQKICDLLRSRNKKGLDLLFQVYYTSLVLWANTFLNSLPAAEDLVQEFFIAVWKDRFYEKFQAHHLSSFLRIVVKNRALNKLQKRDVLQSVTGLEHIELAWEEYNDRHDRIVSAVQKEILLLPPRSREIMLLVFQQGMKYQEVAKQLNISLSTLYPFKRKKAAGEERWYEKISIRYTGRLTNSIQTKDNLLFKSNLIKDWKNGMKHEIPVSATFTLFKYFNVTPSVSYTERWYTRKVMKDWDPNAAGGSGKEVATDTIYGFHRVYNYNASLGINTKIYGMYNPIFLPKKKIQIRHVITPSVSISAAPDFGSSRYGYYESYIRNYADGRRDTVTYSPYSGQAFDVPGRGKQGNITFSISNNLEMKYYSSKKDTVKKVSLIDELGANISYNMAAATRPWSDLGLNLRLKLSKNYTFSMSSSFKTYGYKFDKNGNVVPNDRTEWSYGRFGIFQGYGSSFSYTFNNDTWKKWKEKLSGTGDSDKEKKDEAASEEGEGTEDGSDDTGIPKKKVEKAAVDSDGYQVFKMPWSLNFNYSFNISEDTSKPINRKTMRYPYRYTHNLSASGNIKLSNKWAVSFNSGYDFEAKKIVQTTFNITRDLHCFSMSASLSPFGQWKYYNFTIRANASILQDLKWEQRSQTQSNIQWY